MLALCTVLGALCLGVLSFVTVVYVYIASDPTCSRRKWFSRIPMGLLHAPKPASTIAGRPGGCTKKVKAHAIVDVSGITYERWMKQLSRSARQTVTKQVAKRFERENIQVVRKRPCDLAFYHWKVVFDHQRRS